MDDFLATEVAMGRIDGPFTISQAHAIFGGHFHTTVLSLVKKLGSTALQLIRHHSKEDHLGESTNGWIDSAINATKYFSAADTADFVSIFLYFYYPPHPHSSCRSFFTWQ